MKNSTLRKKFIAVVGERLRKAFERSNIRSYKELAREAAKHGHKFSAELLARYFSGTIEPGIYSFCGILTALDLSADQMLFGHELALKGPKRKKFVSAAGKRLQKALEEGDLRSSVQMAVIAENFGYDVKADDIESFLQGLTEPGIYEFAAMLDVLKQSADAVLFGREQAIPSGVLVRDTADKLMNLLQKSGSADSHYQELTRLYSSAPANVQKAVLELLRSAAPEKKAARPRKKKK